MYHSETIVKNDGARYRYLYNSDSASQIFVPGSETEGFFFCFTVSKRRIIRDE